MFNNIYQDRTVLVTGHTGFKGAWLVTWLTQLGAHVVGYSLPEPTTTPNLFDLSCLHTDIIDVRGDIRDWARLWATIEAHQPSIVFHLAAQAIVGTAIRDPKPTFDINAGGTVNLLEAVRKTDCVKAVVAITTDKVYRDEAWVFGYRETDALGGKEPYAASKAMAELAVEAYRKTYLADRNIAVASARAGNVIGGGDFSARRLIPDIIRALNADKVVGIRTPHTVRPWQHVLEPLSGYLWLGAKLLQEGQKFAEGWNFAPAEQVGITTQQVVEKLIELWGSGAWENTGLDMQNVETNYLRLNWDKAVARLGWQPVYTWENALCEIVTWARAFQEGEDVAEVTLRHIDDYIKQARVRDIVWVR